MKLYYSRGACSLVPHILIRELGLDCDLIEVDLVSHTIKSSKADFYQVNPKGAVPTLELDNADLLTENAVIQQYLADTHKATHLLPPLNDMKRYHVLEWLNYVSTELHKSFTPLFNRNLPQEIKDQFFKPLLFKKFDFVNQRLGQGAYLLGEELTLPDFYALVMILWTRNFHVDLKQWPNIARFYQNLCQRPSVMKAFEEEGLRL